MWIQRLCLTVAALSMAVPAMAESGPLVLDGVVVTPHVLAERMKYGKPPKENLSARVEQVWRNVSDEPVTIEEVRFNDETPEALRTSGVWAWHGMKSIADQPIPPGGRTVLSYNGRDPQWGIGTDVTVTMQTNRGAVSEKVAIEMPTAWLSAVTFLGEGSSVSPDRVVCHWANSTENPLTARAIELYVPSTSARWNVFDRAVALRDIEMLPKDGAVPPGERGIVMASCDPLPLSYGLVRLAVADAEGGVRSLWGKLRIKRESFDISGGWVGNDSKVGPSLTYEPFLKALKKFHINTAHIAETAGYTDNEALYSKYPLKYFNRLQPFEHYDSDAVLPRIHAAEFLGEPQYPNPENLDSPQRVFDELAPYMATRIPTSVTLSDESTWRYYAGLSDYPHYDAYRVVAPHVDAWPKYDRWGGKKIYWGAPLETIGDMTRSLRELSRPAPIAYWGQGPHSGWQGFDGRRRRSPTADELRLQAYHALAARITSLYWFNLSPKSLVAFRDTLEELTRVGREIRMLEDFYLEGDAYWYLQMPVEGVMGWDLSTIVAPQGALLFALDLDYSAHPKERVFTFPEPREVSFEFGLPTYLREPKDVFRVDADGVHDVTSEATKKGVRIMDTLSKVGVYVATNDPQMRERIVARRKSLLEYEASLEFDPANSDEHFEQLSRMVGK